LLISVISLIESEATTGRNSTFFQSLAFDKELGATQGIDAALRANHLDALVLPATGLTTVPAGMVVYVTLTKNDLKFIILL
jgi:amidase